MKNDLQNGSKAVNGTILVADGLSEYLSENGFSMSEYTAPTFRLNVLGRDFDLTNSKDRQWAIPRHDLHHIATGYGTDWVGEAEIGMWELRAGCETSVVYGLNIAAVLIGLFMSPGRVFAAFRAAKGAKSLYRSGISYEEALSMTVAELRKELSIAAGGLATERRLHAGAPTLKQAALGAQIS